MGMAVLIVMWVIALALIGCLVMLIGLFVQGHRLGPVLMAQLKGLGDTNLLGYEALTQIISKLEERLRKLEGNGGGR
jgi:hypothetical protein